MVTAGPPAKSPGEGKGLAAEQQAAGALRGDLPRDLPARGPHDVLLEHDGLDHLRGVLLNRGGHELLGNDVTLDELLRHDRRRDVRLDLRLNKRERRLPDLPARITCFRVRGVRCREREHEGGKNTEGSE